MSALSLTKADESFLPGRSDGGVSLQHTCGDSIELHYRIEDGRFASCDAVYSPFVKFSEAVREPAHQYP